jgi:hypothetical protein
MSIQNMQMKQMMMLNQTLPQPQPQAPTKLQIQTPKFAKFIALLAYLKQHPLPNQTNPSICMECWLIISAQEVQEHRSMHPKQVTPSFQEMKLASKNDIIDLCQKHGKKEANAVTVFGLSAQVKDVVMKLPKWLDNTFNYLQ